MLSSLLTAVLPLLPAPTVSPVDVPRAASVLVFPIHRSTPGQLTLVSVTNSSATTPTLAFFHYINVVPGTSPLLPAECQIVCRTEYLTPGDTVTVPTSCHNPGGQEGYLLVSAKDPVSGVNWSHNALIGSELLFDIGAGTLATLLPLPFRALPPTGANTDLDFDGKIDFDGAEYEALPDTLLLDSFLAIADARLVLLNLAGDRDARVTADFRVWNDNEFPLSLQVHFRCWFQADLSSLSTLFTEAFLRGTPNDDEELDVDCDGVGDLETGWLSVVGLSATVGARTTTNPPLLGAIVPGGTRLEAGRLLWGSDGVSAGEF
ncbi:MAG: hypothetical protein AAF628_02395 [Planctomycetota bacterium]